MAILELMLFIETFKNKSSDNISILRLNRL